MPQFSLIDPPSRHSQDGATYDRASSVLNDQRCDVMNEGHASRSEM